MKYLIFLSTLFFLMTGFSCSNDELPEDFSEVPDWDYSNAVGDEASEMPDEESAAEVPDESANKEKPDGTSSEEGDKKEEDEEDEETPRCGNGKVEYEERCDNPSHPIECSGLNPSMKGITTCMESCQGYDMQGCGREGKAWGLLNLRLLSNFILDEAKTGDYSYFSKGALPYAAFNGVYGDIAKAFPREDEINASFAVTANYQGTFANKRQLYIRQNPVISGKIGYPRHELEFSPGTISTGSEYRINAITLFDIVDNLLKLVRYRLIENINGSECIMGVGYSGTVFINNVYPNNADLFDGGSVEVVANNVDFYHPSEFPGLDEKTRKFLLKFLNTLSVLNSNQCILAV